MNTTERNTENIVAIDLDKYSQLSNNALVINDKEMREC